MLDLGEISSLNDSKYLLIELPMNGEYDYMDVFENLIYDGYKVILAHPERYHAFQKDFDKIYQNLFFMFNFKYYYFLSSQISIKEEQKNILE